MYILSFLLSHLPSNYLPTAFTELLADLETHPLLLYFLSCFISFLCIFFFSISSTYFYLKIFIFLSSEFEDSSIYFKLSYFVNIYVRVCISFCLFPLYTVLIILHINVDFSLIHVLFSRLSNFQKHIYPFSSLISS